MLWSSPHSARFRPGYKVEGAPDHVTGFLENAPLMPADTDFPPDDDKPRFPKAMFEDLAQAGIDAIDQCCFDNTPLDEIFDTLEAARRSGTGVRVFPMIDRMTDRGRTFLVELWNDRRIMHHPNLLRVGERPVIITFAMHGAEKWRERLDLAEEAGADFIVISDALEYEGLPELYPREVLEPLMDAVDGLYCFMDLTTPGRGLIAELAGLARACNPPKLVGGTIAPGYVGIKRQGTVYDPRGTQLLRERWMAVIREDVDFVYLATLNDYTEATEQQCSANSALSLLDLNAYFGARWKSGTWPAEHRHRAVLSYRKTVVHGEVFEAELVLLDPELAAGQMTRYAAELEIAWPDDEVFVMDGGPAEVLDGHCVWRFRCAVPPREFGFARPKVKIFLDGNRLPLAAGAASFAVLEQGESPAKKWLHVPLHRIRKTEAKVVVGTGAESSYPRTIGLTGLPLGDVACAVIEREAHALAPAQTAAQLAAGLIEPLYEGGGFCPMPYKDGRFKRGAVDRRDRYTAVVRFRDDTFAYPEPVIVDPPKLEVPPLPADIVFAPQFAPGPKILDTSWCGHHVSWPAKESQRPGLMQESDGAWFLRFDGKDDFLNAGVLTLPPGPMTLQVRLRLLSLGTRRTVVDSSEAIASLIVLADGRLRLSRYDVDRNEVVLEGRTALPVGEWTDVLAVFTGSELMLRVNGRSDAEAAPVFGVRGDFETTIGRPAIWANPERQAANFHGDITSIMVSQEARFPR